jgi:hypothetical protein
MRGGSFAPSPAPLPKSLFNSIPQSSTQPLLHLLWQPARATCESQNDRIRHYLPKGTDLSLVSHQQLSAYQEMLNERPRKNLNWKSPAQCFQELLILNKCSS